MLPHPQHSEDDTAWTARLRPLREPALPEPRPFFYTRLEARLKAQTAPLTLPWWLRRPAYATSLVLLVLALNAGAALHYARQRPAPPEIAARRYAAFVADYQLDPFILTHE